MEGGVNKQGVITLCGRQNSNNGPRDSLVDSYSPCTLKHPRDCEYGGFEVMLHGSVDLKIGR